MVIVFVELSTQNICIYVVGNAICICKVFSKKSCLYELLAMSFVYIKVSAQKNLCKNELLAMVFLCVELSTQTLCIQTVGGAACICQIFRKKLCIYELLAMSCIYQTVNKINRVYIYMNCWQWLLFMLNCQHKNSVYK